MIRYKKSSKGGSSKSKSHDINPPEEDSGTTEVHTVKASDFVYWLKARQGLSKSPEQDSKLPNRIPSHAAPGSSQQTSESREVIAVNT